MANDDLLDRYVNEVDKDKPRLQSYKIFVDARIDRPSRE